ncbi:MAG TPA: glycosyltransferase [Gammaproteobacteria bacterium]|nr:glycosyltransferase [Gammaproteobacteria bacterium]
MLSIRKYIDRLIYVTIFCGIAAGFVWTFALPAFHPAAELIEKYPWAGAIIWPSLLWFGLGMALLLARTLLWLIYRPYALATEADAPFLTVIIPAYNEGALVGRSIHSSAAANYPRDRLEIVVVDDGSRDDTWQHITAAALQYPDLVRTIRFKRNRGKRAALAAGFRQARGDVVVTVDSDSIIEPDSLLAIAGPFRDPRVGAVGGKVSVLNRFESLLPRMLHVRFVLAFDFLRSAQSTYGAVNCCPGAFSAYRLSLVRRLLPAWMEQTFLGVHCTTGEDRALTNDILALGYTAVYQRTAVVHTLAPSSYRKLCRMYLRWDRSYVREDVRLLSSVVWKMRPAAMFMTVIDKTITNLRFPIAYLSLALVAIVAIDYPWMIVQLFLTMGAVAFFYMLYYLRSERNWEFAYGILYAYFSTFTLFWIFPYALLTLRNRSWMTR